VELIDLYGDSGRKERALDHVPAWHCRICGTVPVLRHARKSVGRRDASEFLAQGRNARQF
jgi:hypothetical protein